MLVGPEVSGVVADPDDARIDELDDAKLGGVPGMFGGVMKSSPEELFSSNFLARSSKMGGVAPIPIPRAASSLKSVPVIDDAADNRDNPW